MTTNVKSLSEQLFDLLKKDYPIGIRMTSGDLKTTANIHGIKCSEGAIAGFLNRAQKKGVLSLVGSAKIKGNKRETFVYQVMNHDAWAFKGPSAGSPKGREMKGHHINKNVPLIEYNGTHNGDTIKVVEAAKPEPKDKAKVQFGTDKAVGEWAEKCVKDGTIIEEIMIRLAEVMALINAMGTKKNIAEATDDELIAEVKRRFHQ